MTPDADVPGWITRWHQRDARRGDRCRVCGYRKTIATEHGPHCEAHAALLPPPLPRRHDRDEQDQDMTDDHARACSCPFAQIHPHPAAGCRYASTTTRSTPPNE